MKNVLPGLLFLIAVSLPAQNITYRYDNAGNRTQRVIVLNSSSLRSSEAASEEEETTLLEEIVADYAVKIYPNPTKGMLAVEITGISDETSGEIYLVDLKGNTLDRKNLVSGKINFDLSRESPGMYLINIRLGEKTTTWKIIKQ